MAASSPFAIPPIIFYTCMHAAFQKDVKETLVCLAVKVSEYVVMTIEFLAFRLLTIECLQVFQNDFPYATEEATTPPPLAGNC